MPQPRAAHPSGHTLQSFHARPPLPYRGESRHSDACAFWPLPFRIRDRELHSSRAARLNTSALEPLYPTGGGLDTVAIGPRGRSVATRATASCTLGRRGGRAIRPPLAALQGVVKLHSVLSRYVSLPKSPAEEGPPICVSGSMRQGYQTLGYGEESHARQHVAP